MFIDHTGSINRRAGRRWYLAFHNQLLAHIDFVWLVLVVDKWMTHRGSRRGIFFSLDPLLVVLG